MSKTFMKRAKASLTIGILFSLLLLKSRIPLDGQTFNGRWNNYIDSQWRSSGT
jgi:hypothetical protein